MLFTIIFVIIAAALPALFVAFCADTKPIVKKPVVEVPKEPKAFIEDLNLYYPDQPVLFVKKQCPDCRRVKIALEELRNEVNYFCDVQHTCELNLYPEGREVEKYLSELTGEPSVPCLLVDGKFFGGADKIVAMKESGELKKLCIKFGPIAEMNKD